MDGKLLSLPDCWTNLLRRTPLQNNVPRLLAQLTAPCLIVSFEPSVTPLTEQHIEDLLPDSLDTFNTLSNSLPTLKFFALSIHCTVRACTLEPSRELGQRRNQRTWWKIHRREPGAEGEATVRRELIPWEKGERLRDRLHAMDYASLSKLKPEEIEVE